MEHQVKAKVFRQENNKSLCQYNVNIRHDEDLGKVFESRNLASLHSCAGGNLF